MSNLSYWQERHFNCLLDKDNSGVSQSSKLVGRRAELDELIKLSTQFEDNRPQSQFVLLTGDAGIGKSALLSEFAGRARADDALVLFGKATRGSGNMPFNAFADAFEDHDELIQTTAATVATRHCQEFAAVFPALAGNSHGSGDQVTARLSYDGRRAFRELFERLAAAKLVLILDDFHAADPASVELAASMLRRPPDAPMLFLLSCRKVSSELQSAIDRRHQQAGITHIHLRPLSEQHVEEMLADRGTTIWRKELYRGSGGNPAYVKSLIAERPLFSANQDPSIQHLGTASGYHAMFLCDLDGVEAEVRTVAGAAAVVGHDFEVVLVAQILNQPEGAVLEAIDELIKRDVVHHVGHGQFFTFRHPAVYRAVYGRV